MKIKQILSLAIVALLAILALASCSGNNAEYGFTNLNGMNVLICVDRYDLEEGYVIPDIRYGHSVGFKTLVIEEDMFQIGTLDIESEEYTSDISFKKDNFDVKDSFAISEATNNVITYYDSNGRGPYSVIITDTQYYGDSFVLNIEYDSDSYSYVPIDLLDFSNTKETDRGTAVYFK